MGVVLRSVGPELEYLLVLTKLDGTAKGGIVVAVQRELGVPVKLVGLGEGPDDLAPFVPEDFVNALLDACLCDVRAPLAGDPVYGSGSHAARSLGRRRWMAPVLGRSGALLQAGCPPWSGEVPVGMVAGNVPRGLGRLFARFDGESDGTVGLDETRLPGLAAHCTVPASHTGLVFSAAAARQAAHFLRAGRFQGQD